jgi:hypothetical protein
VTGIEQATVRVLADLRLEGKRCALVGGLAVSVRAVPRTTRDLDLAVVVSSDAEAEGLVRRLRGRGYALSEVLEQLAAGRLAAARFRLQLSSGSELPVDLLFASSGIEPEIVQAAENLELVPGISAPVARRGHLIALKVLSHDENRRPQDRQDLLALLTRATEEDLGLAFAAAALITERGFHRDKQLGKELRQFLEVAAPRRTPVGVGPG